jgi:hypothetical protein
MSNQGLPRSLKGSISVQVSFEDVQEALAVATANIDLNGYSLVNAADVNSVQLRTSIASHSLLVGSSVGSLTPLNNTGLGVSALNAVTTGVSNVAMGYNALAVLTSGGLNIAIGTRALETVSTGSQNVAVGHATLRFCTGDQNTAIGDQAAPALTTGTLNTFVGASAGAAVTTGLQDVGIGAVALSSCTSGQDNVAVGHLALSSLTTGQDNVALGNGTLLGITSGSQNVAIGKGAGPTTNNKLDNVCIGWHAGQNINSNGNIIIGSGVSALDPTVAQQLNIGNLIFGDMAAGKVRFGTNATGNLAAQVPIIALVSASADTVPVMSFSATGSNGGSARILVGTRDPSGVVSANAGNLYVRVSGTTSNVYVNRSAADPGTTWTALV